MIRFNVMDEHQIVVPTRFKRANSGWARRDCPEIDDRGFHMGRSQSGLAFSGSRGAMFGMIPNFSVRIKVVREDIDDDAPLYVTAELPDKIEVREPAGGGPIPASGEFKVRGLTSSGSPGKIEIRLGAVDGPIISELEPHVFRKRRIKLTIHNVRIDDASGNGTRPNLPINQMATRIRAIWWPAGLHMEVDTAARPIVNDNITFAVKDRMNAPGNDAWAETKSILNLGGWDDNVHWFIIDDISPRTGSATNTTVGLGIHPDLAGRLGCAPGIITTADGVAGNASEIERTARTVAHEIGHFLTLKHVREQNADNPSNDTYARRQLMYPLSWVTRAATPRRLTGNSRFEDNGYGNRVRGWLLTMKNHSHHSTDGEIMTARSQARRLQTRGGWR